MKSKQFYLCPRATAINYQSSWHPSTNGEGKSLVLRDVTAPAETWAEAESWRPSFEDGGSPGRADAPRPGGLQRIGDANQDQRLDVSDAIGILRFLFGAEGFGSPCRSEEGDSMLLDTNADQRLNLADAVHTLNYLFLAGEPLW